MYLITAIIIAILVFTAMYIKTVNEYFVLLWRVQPLVNGKFKCGFLYSTIILTGEYKGREVVCGLEQIKESSALFVKIKLREAMPLSALNNPQLTAHKVMLSGGWLVPRFYFSRENFNQKSFTDNLDRLCIVCDSLERQMRLAVSSGEHPGIKVEYKVD